MDERFIQQESKSIISILGDEISYEKALDETTVSIVGFQILLGQVYSKKVKEIEMVGGTTKEKVKTLLFKLNDKIIAKMEIKINIDLKTKVVTRKLDYFLTEETNEATKDLISTLGKGKIK